MNTVQANIDFVGTPGKEPGVREVRAYCYVVKNEAASNRAKSFMNTVLSKLPHDGPFFVFEEPPKSDAIVYFRIMLWTVPIDAEVFGFEIDRRRFIGCPLNVSSSAMEVYAEVRRWIRDARKGRHAVR